MSQDIFQPNRLLSLGVRGRDENGDETIRYHSSRLENIEKGSLWVAAPHERGELVPISLGEKVKIFLISKNEVYSFTGEVARRIKKGSMAFLVFEMPTSVVRLQRRDYVRLEISLPIGLKTEDKNWKATIRNISGGGALVSFPEKGEVPELGDEMTYELEINGERFAGRATVIREEDRQVRAIQFSEILEKDREKIIKFIFQKQIELKRKGLLK